MDKAQSERRETITQGIASVVSLLVDDANSLDIRIYHHEADEGETYTIVIYADRPALGQIIGRNGVIADALRLLVRSASAAQRVGRLHVEIVEKGKQPHFSTYYVQGESA